MAAKQTAIVVGGGLAGLAATIRLAEKGIPVKLFSIVPVKRSHSVCAQGGINGAVNTKGEGDHPDIHTDDTLYGGDFLGEQPPVKTMCYAAPEIIFLLDRMGVPFNRTPEGLIDFRRFGGTLHHRTAFSGATTGQQLMYALDEQVRRYEMEGLVEKFEFWEFLGPVKDEKGNCRGIAAANMRTLAVEIFKADAVCMAVGGPGAVFGRSTNSVINTGSAAAACYIAGAIYANGEFIQVHPTAIPGADKNRLISESVRGEGGRVWVPRIKGETRDPNDIPVEDRWYFLEEKYPKYKNLVPRDVATREIFAVCRTMGLGVGGRDAVYLDISEFGKKDPEGLERKLKGVLDIYRKFKGRDPAHIPMEIFPAVHYSMGGLWVDYEATPDNLLDPKSARNQSTNIPGLYAAGECEYQYHGANRLGANSLLSCIFGGFVAAPAMQLYMNGQAVKTDDVNPAVFSDAKKYWEDRFNRIKAMKGKVNPWQIQDQLGDTMTGACTVVRENKQLTAAIETIKGYKAQTNDLGISDTGPTWNQTVLFANQLQNMLELAHVIAQGALNRDESRGAHYKPDFPTRNDDEWQKTTLAKFAPNGPEITYKKVETPIIAPRQRKYS
jgi:succinate dehydrogenase / fumarate reductase, flavoprotein subunit